MTIANAAILCATIIFALIIIGNMHSRQLEAEQEEADAEREHEAKMLADGFILVPLVVTETGKILDGGLESSTWTEFHWRKHDQA